MLPILLAILALGILIFVHELGHFVAAKAFGIRVDAFSLGFGPRMVGIKRGDTDYRISWIPLGGFVAMAGEYGQEGEKSDDPALFTNKKRWQRLIVMAAGASLNIVLAFSIVWGLLMYGTLVPDLPTGPLEVEQTLPDSPAARAGIQPGDHLRAVDGKPISTVEEYSTDVLLKPNRVMVYSIERQGKAIDVPVQIGKHPIAGIGWDGVQLRWPVIIQSVGAGTPAQKAGLLPGDRVLTAEGRVLGGAESLSKIINSTSGDVTLEVERSGKRLDFKIAPMSEGSRRMIGVALRGPVKLVRLGPIDALAAACKQTWSEAGLLFRTLSALVQGQLGLRAMSGPIEIVATGSQFVQAGLSATLRLMAMISLQLGILNLLPIPVLDGGHILILMLEGLFRRDLPLKFKERILQVGLALLVTFSAAVILMDVRKMYDRYQSKSEAEQKPPAAAAPAPVPAPAPKK